jgi:hypothetical protein
MTRKDAMVAASGMQGARSEKTHDLQPQDGDNGYTEPVLATKKSHCHLCRSYIERGESIITADGSEWVHGSCAEQAGWRAS